MNRTQIYITESQRKKLQTIARRNKTTTSALIRSMLQKQLEDIEGKTTGNIYPRKRGRVWAEEVKRINSIARETNAPKDLASNLDKYLYGEK